MEQQIIQFIYDNRVVIAAWVMREAHVILPPIWRCIWTEGNGIKGTLNRLFKGNPAPPIAIVPGASQNAEQGLVQRLKVTPPSD